MLQFIYSSSSFPPFPVDNFLDRPSIYQKEWLLKDQRPSRDFQGYTCQDILTSFIGTVKWAKKETLMLIFSLTDYRCKSILYTYFTTKGTLVVSDFALICLTQHRSIHFLNITYHIEKT